MLNSFDSAYIIEEEVYLDDIPAILLRPTQVGDLLPTIILYHGWGSNKENQRLRGYILSLVGYQVLIPDAIYHGKRQTIEDYNVEAGRKYFWETIFNNLKEFPKILEIMEKKYRADTGRVGAIGNSMGGFTAAGVFTHNPNIKALVVLNGSCYWEDSNRVFKENLDIPYLGDEKQLELKLAKLDPMHNLNMLKDRPILLLHGDADSLVALESQRIFYNKLVTSYQDRAKIRLIEYPKLNHFVTSNMMEESINWFNKYL